MRTATAAAAAAVLGWILAPSVSAQVVSPLPPRDAPPAARSGTAVIKGRVIDAATGQALPRARVQLMGSPGQRDPMLTDDAGAFAFSALPAGRFFVSVNRTGYVMAQYPERGASMRTIVQPLML